MDWANILSAVLAGGIAGQIVTLVWGNSLTEKREFKKWLVAERFKLYSELLSKLTFHPKTQEELNNWTYQIRDISQRIHMLFEAGTAPNELEISLEEVFKLAQSKKDGKHSNNWDDEMRDSVRTLRKCLASNLQAQ
ncbi:hypothetical protein J8M20_15180 [Pseudoalteromonas luteoviolacea]|uniref:hypothetical protein n=1 Tax=Pseudoalteromonas luteoviolacea TaxID=43657 RepID=UPI001B39C292|nr:hypothetical protein [Pseudoalteromonas luteoviolacea]MBQ4812701.1 hypothetical protein [Pseudoalteromonas luteoviolacea]